MPRRPVSRPRLFLLVYGATLMLAGTTVLGLALIADAHVRNAALSTLARSHERTLGRLLADEVLTADSNRVAAAPDAEATLELVRQDDELLAIRLLAVDGSTLASAGPPPSAVGLVVDGVAAAAGGSGQVRLIGTDEGVPIPEAVSYLPISVNGRIAAVAEIVDDARPLTAAIDASRRDVVIVSVGATAILSLLLYLLFRSARQRLDRQTELLVEATRRDPLTGFLTHGAVVAALAVEIEAARESGRPVAVGLLDIDNFRLFNTAHGDDAGDQVLLTVAGILSNERDAWRLLGRYGPDEFLVVAVGDQAARGLEGAIAAARGRLDAVSLRFGSSERLPVSFSAGIAHFPFHAASVADLLAAATVSLGEARASGGNATRTSGAWTEESAPGRSGYDVLHGLVIAVDTKDRYTRRHSEDVARYAAFLVDQLGLDERLRSAVRTAGLLHDVGKIGIPDDILRKPGELTPHEYEIVKQHVLLGDLIVHGVPDNLVVRAGIRHHHERWDGTGYLDRLAGERIPLIARVLAVADAFSAMTTTRPYRKAFPVEVALERIREAAGTQLDPTFATAFADAMASDPSAPMPGDPSAPMPGEPALLHPRLAERVA